MKLSKTKMFLSTLFFLIFFAQAAFPAVTLRIQSISKNININYDFDNAVELVETISIRHRGDATNFFITFSAGNSGQYDPRLAVNATADDIVYYMYDNTTNQNILKDLAANPGTNEVLSGSFPANSNWQTIDFTYTLYIPAGEFEAKDQYADDVVCTLYSGDLSNNRSEDNETIGLTIRTNTVTELSLRDTGLPFDANITSNSIDFGTLVIGETESCDVIARTNDVFSLSITSDNGSVMLPADTTDPSTVPYTLYFDGTPLTLSARTAVEVVTSAGPTDYAGFRYPVDITIGDFGMATEGLYTDTITVDMVAK
ncbi:MAG: hypothetical protein ACLFR1_02815 [Spirochaetia bacterium]